MMKPEEFPPVSVIMPVFNEAQYIEHSLGAVLRQEYPAELIEIIVADGMSTDTTRKNIERVHHQNPGIQLTVVDNPDRFMPMGFNRALEKATGRIIVMLGGHVEIAPDYISACVKLLEDPSVECVGGRIENIATGRTSQAIALAMGSLFGVGNAAFRTQPEHLMETDTAVFGAYQARVFSEIGMLDEEMIRNQDDEFNYRLRKNGGRILFSPDIRSRYYSRGDFLSLWKQYYNYGFYKVRVFQKHPRQMSYRQFVPPVFVLSLVGSLVLALIPGYWPYSLIVPGLYLLVNLSVSVAIASRKGWRYLILLPVAFGILHLSYGTGFLSGVAAFWNRWTDRAGTTSGISHEAN
jgi:succinoglycan biosynthesis protein ExoA